MKVGDLVRKRWYKIEPHEQNTVGVVVEEKYLDEKTNPLMSGHWVLVVYPGRRPHAYRPRELEVVSGG